MLSGELVCAASLHFVPFAGEVPRAVIDMLIEGFTRRTGSGRYVFETRSSRKPANQASTPAASICLKVTPSTPGAPALAQASA